MVSSGTMLVSRSLKEGAGYGSLKVKVSTEAIVRGQPRPLRALATPEPRLALHAFTSNKHRPT